MNPDCVTHCVTSGLDPAKMAVYQASLLGTRLMVGQPPYPTNRRNPQISASRFRNASSYSPTYARICGASCVTFSGGAA